MAQTIKVAILGAAGESGGLVLNGLLESDTTRYDVTALVLPSSISKPTYKKISDRGVKVVSVDLDGAETEIAEALQGFDVVIASVPPTPQALASQLPLARAAKLAGVKRFVPSSFAMAIAPNGISTVQTMKENIYAELSSMDLPHTIIDVGWWYNGFIPKVPPGKTDYAIAIPDFMQNLIPGDGNTKTHVVDPDDIGRFVARILADPETINKRVMASGAVTSFNEMFDVAEDLIGDKTERKYITEGGLQDMIAGINSRIELEPENYMLLVGKFWL